MSTGTLFDLGGVDVNLDSAPTASVAREWVD
jgi:hypothetical protein